MMKKFFAVALFVVLHNFAFAQKDQVLSVFKKYNINEQVLDPNLRDNIEKYAYNLQRTVTLSAKDKVYQSSYDPTKDEASRWTLNTVNGKKPSKHDINAFNDEHAIKVHFKVDESTYKVAKDDGKMVEITYQYDPSSLDSEHQFLKDCVITLFINAKTGLLEKSSELNLKNLKIKILKITKLTSDVNYLYNQASKSYTVSNETITVIIKMLGNEIPMITTNTYTLTTK